MAFKLDHSSPIQVGKPGAKRPLHLGGSTYQPLEQDNNRTLRWAVAAAVAVHVLLLVVTLPKSNAEPRAIASSQKVYLVEEVRFQPPPPKQAQRIPKKQTHRIPIPDPTPDEPEPLLDEDIETPDLDIDDLGELFVVPEAPASSGPGAMWLDGNIDPPKKIHAPQPRYTESARKARIQGVVILQAIVDAVGNVTNVKILKGLPEGLAESAVETVLEWRFKPATLEGEPVPVYLNLTISFSLQ